MKSFVLILFLTFAMCAEAKNCAVYLAENNLTVSEDPTENLIAFLSELYKKQTLKEQDILKIAEGNFENPLKAKSSFDTDHKLFLQIYDELFALVDKNKIQNWAAIFIKNKQQVQKEKDQAKKSAEKSTVKMQFHRIEPGSFVVEIDGNKSDAILNTPFEMMSTSVTRGMWKDLMGEYTEADFTVGDDYPVNLLTWWSAIAYANTLSKRDNLPEVYDLSEIKDWEGSAEKGSWCPKDKFEAARALKINAPDGDIYKAKGYRLPTDAEYTFVMTDRGRSNTRTFTNITNESMIQYAWSEEHNIEIISLMPVAELRPFVIDGNAFYDLYGNANEWLHDIGKMPLSKSGGIARSGGLNPLTSIEKIKEEDLNYRHVRGNPKILPSNRMSGFASGRMLADERFMPVSFRLVRSLEK